MQRISEVPTDPLTGNEFAYSTTQATGEYQLGTIVEREGSLALQPSFLTQQSYAAESVLKPFATTLIKGNYNGKFITHRDDTQLYIIAAPSILANEISGVTIQDIHANQSFVYEGAGTPPATYSGSVEISNSWSFTPANTTGDVALIYTGSTSELSSSSGKLTFITNLKNYYAGTDVAASRDFESLETLDPVSNPNRAIALINTYVESNMGGLGGGDVAVSELSEQSD